MRDQAEKLRKIVQQSRFANHVLLPAKDRAKTRVIAVTSGKGGVGKTNFTVNLALALAGLDQKVVLLDADLGMANVDVVLGCPATYNLLNLVEDRIHIEDVTVNGPRGIRFLSGGSGVYELANMNSVQIQHILSQLSALEDWADIILVDTGAGIGRNVLDFVIAADEVIIITTPDPTAMTDAYAMMKVYAGQRGTSPLRLVVNRVLDSQEGRDVAERLNTVATRFLGLQLHNLGMVYEDINMRQAVKFQTPVLLAYPDSVASQCIESVARKLLYTGSPSVLTGIRGFFDRIFDII